MPGSVGSADINMLNLSGKAMVFCATGLCDVALHADSLHGPAAADTCHEAVHPQA